MNRSYHQAFCRRRKMAVHLESGNDKSKPQWDFIPHSLVVKNLSNVLLESLDNLVDWRKFSLHIINECINFSNHLANYLAIPSETESVITLWFVIPLLQDALEELLPMCPRRCVHSVHSSKICNSKKREINLHVRQQEDRCEHTRVHALARILCRTEHERPVATCTNVKHLRIMILGTHCRLWKTTEIMTFIRSFKTL